mgnify:CR=1 FL=1
MINDASVYDVAIVSPITFAKNLSSKLKNDVYLKREDLQPIFSFKNIAPQKIPVIGTKKIIEEA